MNITAADEAILQESKAQKGHPKGLGVLFTTEMWERFNFYGMRALLTLFLAKSLLMGEKEASIIYGGFLGLCYLTPMLGGYISDKYLGNRNCITLGGLTMGIGQLLLFSSASVFQGNIELAKTLMWVALGVIIMGNGFFKPNISSMVGQLYPKEQKNKLDSAFTIFYMGINIGALLGQTICPLVGDVEVNGVRDLTAFKWGFLAAGIAMFLGVIIFSILKNKYVVTPEGQAIGGKPQKNVAYDDEAGQAKFSKNAIRGSLVAAAALIAFFYFVAGQNIIYSFIYSSGLTLAGLIMTDQSLTKVERQRILVLYIAAFFVIFFWAAFEQAGSSLTFIADNQTDTRILGWRMPPSMVQNFNGLFVIIFALPFSALWIWLSKRNAEPISPVKQAFGLALIALGYLIIAMQVKGLGTAGKIGVIWLIVLYLLHTWGELCLSPIGLSLVAKLAPRRFSSLLMGVWFLSNAAGYALTGTLGALLPPTGDKYATAAEKGINLQGVLDGTAQLTQEQTAFLAEQKIATAYPQFAGFTIHNLYEFFMVFVILCGVASVILYLLSPILKRMMHGVR
ncbi:peptide MFS transporter [Chitinophagaceae bacterium LB-8]|uniref:Peptide MFS transporter n=1 Tax=Paraflavisolibacter caeni TaxID=2982496 RepID=A0A9X2XXJ3_9BACT|nr:peptide MFS transporter [Paraflavisolibacter caeni]MCU7550920.1 peptide MFS transporter [Paraflavisolibacter caeni]